MTDVFFIDTGNVITEGADKKSKKAKGKSKKTKAMTLEAEPQDDAQFRYVSQSSILGEEVKEEKEVEQEDNRPKGRRPNFRRSSNKRYHENSDEAIQVGVLSDSLREALGMHRGQVPFFIYRMRSLGYPPGWLKNHERERSGLSIVGEDDDQEDHVEYDLDQLLQIPGFNAPLPKGVVDDWKRLGALPMQKEHSLEAMRQQLVRQAEMAEAGTLGDRLGEEEERGEGCGGGKKKKKNKKKRKREEAANVEEPNGDPAETKMARTDVPDASSENSLVSETDLTQLEAERRRIIDQLNSTQAEEGEEGAPEAEDGPPEDAESSPARLEPAETPVKTSEEQQTRIAASMLGSPVCLSLNASRQLPDPEKFSEGIEEFRAHEENEGAGTYQKVMSALRDAKRSRKP